MNTPTPTPADILIDGLATLRATRLITEDTITAPVRSKIFRAFPLGKYPHGPAYLATCPYCSSIYAAAAITATHAPKLRFLRPVVYLLAIAAPVSIIADRTNNASGSPSGWS